MARRSADVRRRPRCDVKIVSPKQIRIGSHRLRLSRDDQALIERYGRRVLRLAEGTIA